MQNDSIPKRKTDNNFCNGQNETTPANALVRKQEIDVAQAERKHSTARSSDREIVGVLTKTREVATSSPDPAEAKQTPMAKSWMP
jgi:hypothetical protein